MAAPTIVNSQWSNESGDPALYALAFTPTAGNTLLVLQAIRGTWTTGTPGEIRNANSSGALYTSLRDYGGDNPFGGGGGAYWDSAIQAAVRVATGTETQVWIQKNGGSGGGVIVVLEIAGTITATLSAIDSAIGAGGSASGPAVTPTNPALVIGWLEQGSDFPNATRVLAAGADWTLIYSETIQQPERWKPHPIAVYRSASAGSSSPSVTSDQTAPGWTGITVAFVGPPPVGLFADWDGDGFGDPGTNDDLTADIESWVITRGASPEITGGATPGSMTVTLNNRADDRYNPINAGAPLFGKLVDGVPLWLGIGADGTLVDTTIHGLFGGRLTDPTPIPSEGGTYPLKVQLAAQDCLGWYGRTPVRLSYAEGRSQGALRAALLDAAGETRYTLDNEISTLPLSSADGNLLTVLEALNQANGTRHFCDPADTPADWYTYRTRNRQWRLDATVDASLSVQDDHVTGSGGWRLSADTVINRQKATVTPVVFTPATATVWEASELPIEVTTRRPLSMIVDFDDYVDSPILDYAATGAALSTSLTPFGNSAKIELAVASGTAVVNALSIEGRLARRAPTESYVSDNTSSQAGGRGIREGSEISGEYVGTLASAAGIARHVTWRYGTPQLRPTLTVENWLPEMFALDLFDVISVTSPQLSMTNRLFEIVGLTHEGRIAAPTVVHHIVTYVLQECRAQTNPHWFILGSSLLGGTDILAA